MHHLKSSIQKEPAQENLKELKIERLQIKKIYQET